MKARLIVALSLIVLVTAALAAARTGQARKRVLVLPVLNMSGEKWEELKEKQIDKAQDYLRDELAKRELEMIPMADVKSKLSEAEIDLTDEEQQKRSVLFDLGSKMQADYVIFAIITDTTQAQRDRTFYTDIEGRTDVKLWLLDVAGQKPIISAKTFIGRSGGNRITFDNKGSERQIQATANALRDALKGFFRDYPVVK